MKHKAHILIVDDEATIRNFLVRVLERESYTVTAAQNGVEALRVLESLPVDLMLSDIRMDAMDGVDLLKQARERYPDLAVLLLTGHATVDSAIAALRHGALNYLLKPIKNEELVAAVVAGLEVRQHQQRRDKLEVLAQQFSQVVTPEDHTAIRQDTTITYGKIRLNLAGYIAHYEDKRLNLTPTEFRLLAKFTQAPGVVFDYVELVRDACGYVCARHEAQEIISTHIRNLRSKLSIAPEGAAYIESVRSVGYRLSMPQEGSSLSRKDVTV